MGNDFLRHPNGSVPTLFLVPNLAGNYLAICLLLDHVGGALDLILAIDLGVDEGALDDGVHHLALNPGQLLDLGTLVGLVAFFMALEARHGCSLLRHVHHVITVILRRLVFALALQSHQVLP